MPSLRPRNFKREHLLNIHSAFPEHFRGGTITLLLRQKNLSRFHIQGMFQDAGTFNQSSQNQKQTFPEGFGGNQILPGVNHFSALYCAEKRRFSESESLLLCAFFVFIWLFAEGLSPRTFVVKISKDSRLLFNCATSAEQ